MTPYQYLIVAIISEVIATTALKVSLSFTRPLPSLLVVLGYSSSFYCLYYLPQVYPTQFATADGSEMMYRCQILQPSQNQPSQPCSICGHQRLSANVALSYLSYA